MTDQEHAAAIRSAIVALSNAVDAARKDGLFVKIDAGMDSNKYYKVLNWLRLDTIARHF